MTTNLKALAKRIIPLIDLTNLNDSCAESDIVSLCDQAQTDYGHVAAVCLYPSFIKLAKQHLKSDSIGVATVVNFPKGNQAIEIVTQEITQALQLGADEVDVVFPYERYLSGDQAFVEDFILQCRDACDEKTLKVILETGSFPSVEKIYEASFLLIDLGANFLKTSTGKAKQGASIDAAAAMLMAIKDSESTVGFKASGGIRTLEDAAGFLALADNIMGETWIDPSVFRFGASGLLKEVLSQLD